VWALADMTLAGMASDNLEAGKCATAKALYLAAGNAGVNAFNFELADFNVVGQVLAFFAYIYIVRYVHQRFPCQLQPLTQRASPSSIAAKLAYWPERAQIA
jgi:hypothetical protein